MRTITLIVIYCLSINYTFAKKINIVTSTTMIADMTRQIVGDRATVRSILPIGTDPHVYEATPSDAQKVAEADLLLLNGLTLEGWLSELIENGGTKAKIVVVTEGVMPIVAAEHAGSADPHAWMTAANGLIYIKNIFDAVAAKMPEERAFLTQEYTEYKQRLEALDSYIAHKMREIPENKRVLVTSHDAFHYFGTRYGLRLESVLGTSTDADIQTSDIIRLIKVIKETGIGAIFIESTINPKVLKQIAADNDVVIGGSLFADSLGDENSGADTYEKMLKRTADVIAEGLVRSKNSAANTHFLPFFKQFGAYSALFLLVVVVLFVGLGSGYVLLKKN